MSLRLSGKTKEVGEILKKLSNDFKQITVAQLIKVFPKEVAEACKKF